MFLTKIGSHKKRKLKKVMKKSLGEGVNLPHPNRNRVKDDKKYSRSIVILQKTLKIILKMLKRTFISQQTYLYIQVTDILKFYEVLFCTYCKGLFYL